MVACLQPRKPQLTSLFILNLLQHARASIVAVLLDYFQQNYSSNKTIKSPLAYICENNHFI